MNLPVVTVTLNPALDKSVIVPQLQIGGLNRVQQLRVDPGGKGINVAKVLTNFGIDVRVTGLVAGTQGRKLINQLEAPNLNIDFLEIQGETRINLKIIDETSKVTTEINEQGFEVSLSDLILFREKLNHMLAPGMILVMGGSLPPGVPENIYEEYILMANEIGVKTILDADGVALKEGIKAKPFAIKPNLYEMEQLVGRELSTDAEVAAAGAELIAGGISLIAISMGSRGSIILNRTEAYRVEPFTISPQSTVGAGDSMVAALVYSLIKESSLAEMAIMATAAGTLTAAKEGTQVCKLEEVLACTNQVLLTKLSTESLSF